MCVLELHKKDDGSVIVVKSLSGKLYERVGPNEWEAMLMEMMSDAMMKGIDNDPSFKKLYEVLSNFGGY